ncbi:hypothetical protein EYR40_000415 [Pleurotus pulmonarius]|nr:hypothetical protein EYR36_001228 [Pleurotus pulmonarius]KAF4603253.1 hypothetical protein EYR38_003665 [Pleurotus pulmonarius]KAF4608072.1 hypothetical protein EYR40_000415 [Pleurotus pulmonarius]
MSTVAGTPKATPTKPAAVNSFPAPPNFFGDTASDTTFIWNQIGKNPVPLTSKTPTATTRPTSTTNVNASNANANASSPAQPFKFNPPTAPTVTMAAPCPAVSSTPVALTPIPPITPPVRKHDFYYFPDGSVIIQVDEVLFNLHRSILTLHSRRKFADLGLAFRTDTAPLVLKGVNLKDFECLLGVLYPQTLGVEEETRTAEQWVSIMKQAHMWGIDPLKQRAAKHLRTMVMPPAERVNLFQHCRMSTSPDLLPALLDLCLQEESVGLSDAELLGLETFTKVVKLRERRLKDFTLSFSAGDTKAVLCGLINKDILGLAVGQTALLEARGSPNHKSRRKSKPCVAASSSSSPLRTPSTSSSPSSPGSSADGHDDGVKVEKPASGDSDALVED